MGPVAAGLPQGRQDQVPFDIRNRQTDELVHGGLLMFDGERTEWLDMLPGTIGYIPPGWAHRSVNTGDEPYAFLAVYPGGAGHDYGWVLEHGMGSRAYRAASGVDLRPYAE